MMPLVDRIGDSATLQFLGIVLGPTGITAVVLYTMERNIRSYGHYFG
jgi:hypothetical protein